MRKCVEVSVQTIRVFAVIIDDDESIEDAEGYALDKCIDGNSEVKESFIAATDLEAEAIRRHADEII